MARTRRTADHAAVILMAMFIDWEKARMRISQSTLKKIGNRKQLKAGFVREIREWLAEYGFVFVELDDGAGYCVVRMTALTGVAPYTLKRFRGRTEFDLDEDVDELWDFVEDRTGTELGS